MPRSLHRRRPDSQRKRYKPGWTKRQGRRYQPNQTSECNWCLYGRRPGPAGLCDGCVLKFRRILQSNRWRLYRQSFLSEHRFCVECKTEGRMEAATNVDHIKPWRFYPDLFWIEQWHQGLCHRHHSRKTVLQDGAFGRERKKI